MPTPAKKRVSPPIYSASRSLMIALLTELARGEGFSPSLLPGVKFMRSLLHVPPSPITYDPSIVIIANGRKVGRLGARRFVYDASNYLVLTLPLPFECETFGSPEDPLLGFSVQITPALIAGLLMQLDQTPFDSNSPKATDIQVVESTPLEPAIAETSVRLLEALRSPEDARILGPQLVRELAYRVLRGPLGGNLRALAAPHTHFAQIGRVLNRIHTDFAENFNMEALAREAGMSVSTFHTHFKAVTSSSPLQYLKTIRLHKARMLMVHDGATAASAALHVGYESTSQFSREFKRHFGAPPAAVAHTLRENLVRLA